MDTCLYILLPYGLSSQYQTYLAGNDDLRTRCGPPQFRTASLLELSKLNSLDTNKSLPTLTSVPKRQRRTRRLKLGFVRQEENNMRLQRNIKKSSTRPATGRERHGRARRKPQTSVCKTPKAGSKYDLGTQVGASQELPITLDSDNDAPASTPLRPSRRGTEASLINPALGGSRYESTRSQDMLSGSVHTPLENTYAPTGFVLRRSSAHTRDTRPHKRVKSTGHTNTQNLVGSFTYQDVSSDAVQSPLSHEEAVVMRKPAMRRKRHQSSSPPAADDGNIRVQGAGIYTGRSSDPSPHDRSTTMADARTSRFSTRMKPDTPAPWGTRLPHERPRECRVEDINMSLLDIDDFSLRSKVAQLMAIAPALAIIDLYHLVIDSEGDLPRARRQAIRMSEAPAAQYRPGVDEDGDEIMVKIDPNDPAFVWDEDEPQPELGANITARSSKSKPKPKPKSKLGSSATKSRSIYSPAKNAESDTKNRSNMYAKRTKSAPRNPTHARETSSDRDFVVPDNVIHYDVDFDVFSDSDQSIGPGVRNRRTNSDADMLACSDSIDLDIDMQPRFAYNAGLLEKYKKS